MKKLLLILSAYGAWWLWKQTRPPQGMAYLNGRVVIITGASSGIGKAVAKTFAGQGAKVVLVARREDALKALKEELESVYNTQALVIKADLTNEAELQPIINKTLDEFGQIDVLVNNAGDGSYGRFDQLTFEEIEHQVTLNLTNTIKLTQLVLPTMKQQQRGHIVNIGSIASYAHAPMQVNYSATKAGLLGFSEALRREVKSQGIDVSIICPGFTNTAIIGDYATADQALKVMSKASGNAVGLRIFTPEEIAGEIVNAVRYNRARVIKGGALLDSMVWAAQHAPEALDKAMEELDYKGGVERFLQLKNNAE